MIGQAGEALLGESGPDPADLDRGVSGAFGDGDAAESTRHQQHRAGPPGETSRTGRGALQSLERGLIDGGEDEFASRSGHRRPSTLAMEAMLS